MPQDMVGQDQCCHCLHDGNRPRHHTRIMSSLSLDDDFFSFFVEGILVGNNSGYRLESYPKVNGFPVGDPTLNAS